MKREPPKFNLDDCSELWRSEQDADTDQIQEKLRSTNRLLRQFNVWSFGIGIFSLVPVVLIEITSDLQYPGLITLVLVIGLSCGYFKYRRDKRRLKTEFQSGETNPRKFLIGRLKAGRLAGWTLMLMPAYVLLGFAIGFLFFNDGSKVELSAAKASWILGITLLLAPVVFLGWRIKRRFQKELQEFR